MSLQKSAESLDEDMLFRIVCTGRENDRFARQIKSRCQLFTQGVLFTRRSRVELDIARDENTIRVETQGLDAMGINFGLHDRQIKAIDYLRNKRADESIPAK